jgi:hypothetical protein
VHNLRRDEEWDEDLDFNVEEGEDEANLEEEEEEEEEEGGESQGGAPLKSSEWDVIVIAIF